MYSITAGYHKCNLLLFECLVVNAIINMQFTPWKRSLLARDYVILLIMAPASHSRNGKQLIRQIYLR